MYQVFVIIFLEKKNLRKAYYTTVSELIIEIIPRIKNLFKKIHNSNKKNTILR